MEWLTHLAAIAVGVAIAFLFLGGKTETKPSSESVAPSAAAKKKKKNKKKKKAVDPAPVKESEPPKSAPQPPKETPKAPPKEETPAPAPVNGGKKKKNKKKKATNGSATPAPAPAPKPAPAPAAKPPAPAPAIVPLQPRIVIEEEWATIPKKSKKKKTVVKKQQDEPAAAAKAPEAAPKASVTVTIDASRVGIIIGPKGATMNAIQEKTGTKLDVNAPKPDEKSGGNNQFRPVVGGKSKAKATVVITEGTTEGMKAAKKAILELADRGYAALLQAEGFGESSVAVHPRFLSEIVGTGGKIIKAIQSELDVKLTIPKTDWNPKSIQVRSNQSTIYGDLLDRSLCFTIGSQRTICVFLTTLTFSFIFTYAIQKYNRLETSSPRFALESLVTSQPMSKLPNRSSRTYVPTIITPSPIRD